MRGFTLIELVTVMVLLGIVAIVLAPVISANMSTYSAARDQVELTARGRLALERLAREVRHAVPNTLRVVADGRGIEFLRSRHGGRYVSEGDPNGSDWCLKIPGAAFSQAARCFVAGEPRSELYVLDDGSDWWEAERRLYLVIGNASPDDLGASTAELQKLTATTAVVDGVEGAGVLRFTQTAFLIGSPGRHFFIADDFIEVGVSGDRLHWRQQNGVGEYNGSGDWDGADPILVDGLRNATFSYSPGIGQGNGVLSIELELKQGAAQVVLYQNVQVRNAM